MKKLILMFTVCLFAVTGQVFAQGGSVSNWYTDFMLKEGTNKLASADGKENCIIVLRGGKIAQVGYVDAAGKNVPLVPAQAVIPGAPKADCNTTNTVQYFNNSTSTVGLFICTTERTKIYNLDLLTNTTGGTRKALNRRVEVKLVK